MESVYFMSWTPNDTDNVKIIAKAFDNGGFPIFGIICTLLIQFVLLLEFVTRSPYLYLEVCSDHSSSFI